WTPATSADTPRGGRKRSAGPASGTAGTRRAPRSTPTPPSATWPPSGSARRGPPSTPGPSPRSRPGTWRSPACWRWPAGSPSTPRRADMSAYIVDDETINRVLAYLAAADHPGARRLVDAYAPADDKSLPGLGAAIRALNVRAVRERYPDCAED